MPRCDVIVLGAGIVGTSVALHLVKRGYSVVLVDRRGPGEETSYGNAGVIEGNTLFPHAFPSGLFGAVAGRAQAGAGGELPPVVPADHRALADGISREDARRRQRRLRHRHAPAVCARGERARGADGAGRRHALSAQGRLAQGLSRQFFVQRRRARARFGRDARPQASRDRRRGGARARAFADAGVSPRRALAGCRERVQSAGGDQSLFRAIHPARWHPAQRRRAHAAPHGRRLAGRHRRGLDRRQGRRDRARPLGARCPGSARHQAAARLQARLSPPLPPAGQRRPDPAGGGRRQRLLPRADGAGHPADHRGGICQPRRQAHAGAIRPADAGGARVVPARRRHRAAALDGVAAVLCRIPCR